MTIKSEVHFFEDHKEMERQFKERWDQHKYTFSATDFAWARSFRDSVFEDVAKGVALPVVFFTTQMSFLSTEWFEKGFRIFVHDSTGCFEIKLGSDNERTKREIRKGHDLFKMWKNGEFEKVTYDD